MTFRSITRELYREGSFAVNNPVDVTDRCGIGDGPLVFRYEVRLAARNLNGRGFILDNRLVNTYWQMKWGNPTPKTLPSCEEIAEQALQDFRAFCRLEQVELVGAEIWLYGGTYSGVAARWGKIAPAAPRPAMSVPVPEPQVEPVPEADPAMQHLLALLGQEEPRGTFADRTMFGKYDITNTVRQMVEA